MSQIPKSNVPYGSRLLIAQLQLSYHHNSHVDNETIHSP